MKLRTAIAFASLLVSIAGAFLIGTWYGTTLPPVPWLYP